MKRTAEIRVDASVEQAGLDVSEHGMWGYPEFYIPVPGGYGSESRSAALSPGMRHHATAPVAEPAGQPV